MAYLPTVNETKESFEVGDSLIKTLKKRYSFSLLSRKVIADPRQTSESLATKQDNSTTILNKLYQFIVKDTQRQEIEDEEKLREHDQESDENEFIQKTLIEEIYQPKKETKEEPEGMVGKLIRYLKYFSFGKSVYKNWDIISKFLGLEKLTESIRSISNEFNIIKVIEEIKTAINNIIDEFGLGNFKFETSAKGVSGVRGGKTINAADPSRVNQAMQFFISKGLTPEQAAGIVGNMLQENPAFALDIGGDHGAAGGLFQWQGARQMGMGDTFESQLQHMWDEMTGKSPTRDPQSEKALKLIRKTSSPEEASRIFSELALRPGKPMMENRIRYAGGALETYTTGKAPEMVQPISSTKSPNISDINPPLAFKPDNDWSITTGGKSISLKPINMLDETDTKSSLLSTKSPTRMPKNYAEPGEIGAGEMTPEQRKSLVNRDIATKEDLNGLNFVMHHGEDDQILKSLAQKLQKLKSSLGLSSLTITSGYRPKKYNEELAKRNSGVAKDSFHTYRKASDIIIPRGYTVDDVANFVRTASKLGFGGIGVYLKSNFIHLDIGPVRTWTYGLPKPIQDALTEHTSGRIGHQVIKDIPEIVESGETNQTEGGNKSSQENQKQQDSMEKFDYLKFALDSYKTQLSIVNNIFNQALSGQSVAKVESMLEQLSGNIPRKDNIIPDMSGMFMQNNMFIINTSHNKYTARNINDTNSDVAPIFNNPFLSNYYKD